MAIEWYYLEGDLTMGILDLIRSKKYTNERVTELTGLDLTSVNSAIINKADQSEVDELTSILADMTTDLKQRVINVRTPPYNAKADGITDDTTAITNALNALLSTGGTLFFPAGNYKYSTINLNQNIGKTIVIEGAGIGVTTLSPTGDGIAIQSYLVHVKNLTLSGSGNSNYVGIRGVPISPVGDAVIGRTWIEYVQITNFQNGIDTKHFDQLWIEKCNVSSNLQYGIYVHPESGAALLSVKDCINNNNGSHGLFVYTSSIVGHIIVENHECVANGGNGVRLEGTTTNTILSADLNNLDIESVSGTSNTALYLKNIWRFNINSGQYTAQSGQTILSSITLNACKQGFILNPWWRSSSDGLGNATNYLYVTGGAEQIYLLGSSYFGTPVDFTIDTATTDPSSCINLDLMNSNELKRFIPANQFYSVQGTPSITSAISNGSSVWKFDQKVNVTLSQAVALAVKPSIRKIKSVTIYWWNDGTGTGNISWQLALKSYTVGQTIPSTIYVGGNTPAGSQSILTKTVISTPNWAVSDIANLWVIRNTGDANDTLTGFADLVGIELNFQ